MKRWTSQYYLKEDKIYRGAFTYSKNELIYGEETFDVYRNSKDQSISYVSESLVKLPSGEILNINVEYIVTKDYLPTFVMIEHAIGKKNVCETFTLNTRNNTLDYNFISKESTHSEVISLAPRYHISTPTAATSFLFTRTKKFDSNSKNFFNVLQSTNHWEFKESPKFKIVILERENVALDKIEINSQILQATTYKLYEHHEDGKAAKDLPFIKCHLSKHGSIPYQISSDDGTLIQIKYLNDLNEF